MHVRLFTPGDGESVGHGGGDTGCRRRARFVWAGGAHQHFAGTALALRVGRYQLRWETREGEATGGRGKRERGG